MLVLLSFLMSSLCNLSRIIKGTTFDREEEDVDEEEDVREEEDSKEYSFGAIILSVEKKLKGLFLKK